MTRKIAKATLSFVMILYFVFLSLFGFADYLYPDTAGLYAGDTLSGTLCFSYESKTPVFSEKGSLTQREEGKILAFGILPMKNVSVRYYEKTNVVCGGELFGVRMNTKGLLVCAVDEITTEKGTLSPGKDAGIRPGDILLSCDSVPLNSAASFSKIIAKSNGKAIDIHVKRGEEDFSLSLTPALSSDNSGYRAGLWVRDGAAGIGTVTFADPVTGNFAGLGHAVCDSETGIAFPLDNGTVCHALVESIVKGKDGTPGEIRGKLEKETTGSVLANLPSGIYGHFDSKGEEKSLVPIGLKSNVKPGKASIFCTLDENGKQEYEIEIEEILEKDRANKNFVVHITDPRLIEKTGGIVQGMSGSPIIQNGHLVGAVTHVLVGDPTRGYGIFIENMLTAMP